MSQLCLIRHSNLLRQRVRSPMVIAKYLNCGYRTEQKTDQNQSINSNSLQRSTAGGGGGDGAVSTDVRPLGEKIKENTKTASYTAIIVAGLSVTGIMLYAIFRELFSSESANNIYSDALERVCNDPRVQDAIGAPIKGFGETSRRGRRQHVAHKSYDRGGVPHMRMQFYVQGIRNKATVQLESRRTPSGKLEYRYLFVQLDHYPHSTIILEDNRAFDPTSVAPIQPNINSLEYTSFANK